MSNDELNDLTEKYIKSLAKAIRNQLRKIAEQAIDESGEIFTPEEREKFIEKLTAVPPIHIA